MERKSDKTYLVFMWMVVCAYSFAMNIVGTTLNPIIDTFSLEGAQTGLISSMINLGGILPLFILPLLQGRIHKVIMLIASCALQLVMLLLTGAATAVPVLLTACLFFGVGNGFTDTCMNSYLMDLYPENNAGLLNILHGVYGLGGLVAPLLAAFIINRLNWRGSYFIITALFAALCLPFVLAGSKRIKPDEGSTRQDGKLTLDMVRAYFAKPGDVLLLLAALFYGGSQLGLTNWAARYTLIRFDDADVGSLCVSMYWVFCAASRMLGGKLRIRADKVLVYGSIGAGIANALGVLLNSAAAMVVASALIGALSGQCIPLLLSEAAHGNERITALTTSGIFLFMNISKTLIPLAMGAVGEHSIAVAMLLPAACLLICAGLCFFGYRLKHRA